MWPGTHPVSLFVPFALSSSLQSRLSPHVHSLGTAFCFCPQGSPTSSASLTLSPHRRLLNWSPFAAQVWHEYHHRNLKTMSILPQRCRRITCWPIQRTCLAVSVKCIFPQRVKKASTQHSAEEAGQCHTATASVGISIPKESSECQSPSTPTHLFCWRKKVRPAFLE